MLHNYPFWPKFQLQVGINDLQSIRYYILDQTYNQHIIMFNLLFLNISDNLLLNSDIELVTLNIRNIVDYVYLLMTEFHLMNLSSDRLFIDQ
jgi:hypothetical protein